MTAAAGFEEGVGRRALPLFFGSVGALAIGYASSVLLARALGPEDRGLLAVIHVSATIGVALLAGGVAEAATYYSSRLPARRAQILGNGLINAALVGVAALVVAAVAHRWIGDRVSPDQDDRLWILAAVLWPMLLLEFLSTSLLAGRFAFGRFNAMRLVGRTATLIGTVLFVIVLDWGVVGGVLSIAVASVSIFIGSAPENFRDGVGLSRRLWRLTARYARRVRIGKLLELANARLDVLVLAALASEVAVGIYVVAQIVAELVVLIPAALGVVLMPMIARGRGAPDPHSGIVMRLNNTLCLAGVAAMAIAGPVVLFLFGPEYESALTPFYVLLPGIWFLGAGKLVGDSLRGRGRPGLSSLLAGGEIVVMVAGDLLLIPPYEVKGAAVASTIAYTCYGAASLVALARLDGVPVRSLLVLRRAEARGYAGALRAQLRRGR